ncbi:MAG: EF-hand domain-containing protein [Blastocatellia bacterium]
MKTRYAICILVTLIATGVGAYAQERRGGPGRPPDMMRRLPLMLALDVNGDGVISEEEISNATAALLKLDKNKDGKLTEEELRPEFPEGPGGRRGEGPGPGGPNPDEMVKQLLEFDKNGDGQLGKDEVPERMHGLFERGDANKDNVLSKDELRKLAEAQSGGAQRAEQEGERRPTRP